MINQINDNQQLKYNCLIIENISKFLNENEKKNIKQKLSININDLNFEIEEDNEEINNKILKPKNIIKYNLKLEYKVIFSFYSNNKYVKENKRINFLFKKIICFHYKKYKYFFFNSETNNKGNLLYKQDIIGILYDLNNQNSIFLINNSFCIINFNFNKKKEEIKQIGKLQFLDSILKKSEFDYQYSAIYLYNKETYLLFLNTKIIGLDNKTLSYFKYIDISFSSMTIPFIYNETLCFISNDKYFYKIYPSLTNSEINSNYISIFGDISLNFSNDKYTIFIRLFKILSYFLLIIQNNEFSNLKDNELIIQIFEEYEINIYTQNLIQFINNQNFSFFLNYNIESSKIKAIILYLLIYEKYDLFYKIYSFQNNSDLFLFKIFLKDFLYDFFDDLQAKIILKTFYEKLNLID